MSSWLEARSASLRPDSLTAAAIVVAFAAAGLLAGVVIASGRPVPIALVLGAITGIALLNALPLVIWIVLVGTLLVSGPTIMFVPSLEKAAWLFSVLGFLLAGAAVLHAAVGRQKSSGPMPGFVLLAAGTAVLGVLSLLYSGGPLGEGVRALKRYFQYFGLLFVLAVVPFAPSLVRRWWQFVVLLAFVQVPFAVFQRLILVPTQEGKPNVIPLDIVVGTMEGSLSGGGSSSVMALLVALAIGYLVSAHREGLLGRGRLVFALVVLAVPLLVGEVTLIVILLPLALVAVHIDRARISPLRTVGFLLVVAPLAAAAGWVYVELNLAPGQTLVGSFDAIVAYNFGTTGYFGSGSLNRTSVYVYWLEHHGLNDPLALVFGHGLGSSFGGLYEPDPGHMDLRHPRLFIGLTAASSLLWDLGLLGLAFYVLMHVATARVAWGLVQSAIPGFDRALCRALFAMSLMLIVMLFYSSGPIALPSQQILTALTLGLIAWRRRSLPARRE